PGGAPRAPAPGARRPTADRSDAPSSIPRENIRAVRCRAPPRPPAQTHPPDPRSGVPSHPPPPRARPRPPLHHPSTTVPSHRRSLHRASRRTATDLRRAPRSPRRAPTRARPPTPAPPTAAPHPSTPPASRALPTTTAAPATTASTTNIACVDTTKYHPPTTNRIAGATPDDGASSAPP